MLLAGAAVIRKPLATGLRVGFADCVFEGTALSQGRGWYLNAATGVNHTASTGQGRSPIEVSLSSGCEYTTDFRSTLPVLLLRLCACVFLRVQMWPAEPASTTAP
eukprot:COSAG04_NODE_713_length_10870_cov_3.260050_6_plen_105_part_00